MLARDSRGVTWDMVLGGFGPDVAFIDKALDRVFQSYAVDPARIAIEGFSDGASYALSPGVQNGGLFTHVMAFSPGFMQARRAEGAPRIFVSHGVDDTILPIGNASRRIVPQLQKARYDVISREFAGPHAAPRALVREAVAWFTGSSGTR